MRQRKGTWAAAGLYEGWERGGVGEGPAAAPAQPGWPRRPGAQRVPAQPLTRVGQSLAEATGRAGCAEIQGPRVVFTTQTRDTLC